MSAFVVSKEHVDLLVSVAIFGPREASRSPQRVGHWDGLRWWAKRTSELAGEEDLQRYARRAYPEGADAIGAMLVEENVRSVRYRYRSDEGDDLPGPMDEYWRREYVHQDHGFRLTATEALVALGCFEYQSCEHQGWDDSEAFQFCDAMRRRLIAYLPGADAAPWEWTAERIKTARIARGVAV